MKIYLVQSIENDEHMEFHSERRARKCYEEEAKATLFLSNTDTNKLKILESK